MAWLPESEQTMDPMTSPLPGQAAAAAVAPLLYPLVCKVQHYAWGRVGDASIISSLLLLPGSLMPSSSSSSSTPPPILVKQNTSLSLTSSSPAAKQPLAELWMGTHPNGPSHIQQALGPTTPLKSILTPSLLHPSVVKAFGGALDLPFLFKVLSIGQALSIQAHPDLNLARTLHAQHPTVYRDANHKPEMALALTPFEALVGFRPLEEIAAGLRKSPELLALLDGAKPFLSWVEGKDTSLTSGKTIPISDEGKQVLSTLFKSLMHSPAEKVKTTLDQLCSRLKANTTTLTDEDRLVLRLDSQYPGGDIGCFAPYWLNYVTLMPGEAIYLAANEPHAYISGDCVECMATSDNVVRAGLTPKFKDIPTLVSMLTYNYGRGPVLRGDPFHSKTHPVKPSPTTTLYNPPIQEFTVLQTRLVPQIPSEEFAGILGPSIVLVLQGEGTLCASASLPTLTLTLPEKVPFARGSVFFIPADVELEIKANFPPETGVEDQQCLIYRAFCTVE